jgi:hypothetical protein
MFSFVHNYIVTLHFSDDAVGKEFPFDISGSWGLFLLMGRRKIKVNGL